MVTFQCKICKKIFDQKCHYIAHLNRQTKCIKYKKSVLKSPQLVLKSPQFDIKEYQCPYCSVFFSRKDNLKRHTRDYCKMKKKQLKMKKKIQIMQKEIDELKQQEKNQRNINGKNNTNQNIIGNNNNTNNIKNIRNIRNIKNNIVINSYGSENMSKMTNLMLAKILSYGCLAIQKYIEIKHFGIGNESNCNIIITNLRSDTAFIYNGHKWVTIKKQKLVDDLYNASEWAIECAYEKLQDGLSIKVIKLYKRLQINKVEKEESTKEDISRLVYDYRDKVKAVRDGEEYQEKELSDMDKRIDQILHGDWVYEPISVESKISAIKKQSNDLDMMLKTVNERFEELVNGFTK